MTGIDDKWEYYNITVNLTLLVIFGSKLKSINEIKWQINKNVDDK